MKKIAILTFLLVSIRLYSQCDNSQLNSLIVINLTCGENSINSDAASYSLLDDLIHGQNYFFTSSTPTDYITIRKSYDNAVVASGISPLVYNYQSSHGLIEMHINTNATCSTNNLNRTIIINGPACCENAVQNPAIVVSTNCGINQIADNVTPGTYSISSGYEQGVTYTISSSVNSDNIIVRSNSTNAVITSGTGSAAFVYDVLYGNIETHINLNATCGTNTSQRDVMVSSQSCCINANQYPGIIGTIQCGTHLLIDGIFANEYNVSTGYEADVEYTFTSTIPTDHITIRSAATNQILSFGIGQAVMVYQDFYGNIEMHINTDAYCNTESSARDAYVLSPPCCDNAFMHPFLLVTIDSCGNNIINNNQESGQFNTTAGYIDDKVYTFKSSIATDRITLRRSSSGLYLASGFGEVAYTYRSSDGDIEMHVNSKDNCNVQNTLRTTSVSSAPCCYNTIRNPNYVVTLNSCGSTEITTNQKSGQYNVSENFEEHYYYTAKSSIPMDLITIKSNATGKIIVTGTGSASFAYESDYGDIEMHINANENCSNDNIDRTTSLEFSIPCCFTATQFPASPIVIPNNCDQNVVSMNQPINSYLRATGFVPGKFYGFYTNNEDDVIIARKQSDLSIISYNKGNLPIFYNASMGDIQLQLFHDFDCTDVVGTRTLYVSSQFVSHNYEAHAFTCDTLIIDNVGSFIGQYINQLSNGVSYKLESTDPTDFIQLRKHSDKTALGITGTGFVNFTYHDDYQGIEFAVAENDNCGFYGYSTRSILITSSSCQLDMDGDAIVDANDNCPSVSNVLQSDTDGDGTGDACDIDFSSQNNIGIGNNDPKVKLHVNGNILIDKTNGSIIMKSATKCWALKVSDDGTLSSVEVDCP